MKRTELILDDIRRSAEFRTLSDGGSILDLELLHYLNAGNLRVYGAIVRANPNAYTNESLVDIVSGTETYDLPSDTFLDNSVLMVEYLYGDSPDGYIKIPNGKIHNRWTDTTSDWPSFYTIENKQIRLHPVPASSKTNGLRVTYVPKIKQLDVRRGVISTANKTGSTLNYIDIDLTPSLPKDSSTVAAATAILNKIDYICVVDNDGVSILDAIPVDSYNSSTGRITMKSGYTTSVTAGSFTDKYVVAGSYTTTHGTLPDIVEPYIALYCKFHLTRRAGTPEKAEFDRQELAAMESDIIESYGASNMDIIPLDPTDIWEGW